jgi:hypothetical protein
MDLAGFRSAFQSAERPSAYLERRWKRINATIIFGLVVLMLYYLGVRPTETFSPIRQVDFQYW